MILRPPRATLTYTLFPDTTLFRSALKGLNSNVTSNIEWSKIRQKQMTVRSSGYQSQPASRKCIAKHPGIIDDLLAVAQEIRLECLMKGHCLGGDDVHERASLCAGKNCLVDPFGQYRIIGKDQAATRSAKRLVGRRCHHMGVRQWIGIKSARD